MRRSLRLSLPVTVLAIVLLAGAASGATFFERQRVVASLQDSNRELLSTADSLRQERDDSIGDRLVMSEATYTKLPKTKAQAEAQGYVLLDKVDSEGEMVEAACFIHSGMVRHYGKPDHKITAGVEWHGAPVLLMYDRDKGDIMGIVLESVSPQPSPPWEHHEEGGHPGMPFEHWSLHIFFTTPP